MDRERELVTLERLERRREDSWPGLWLAPLLTILAQAFLLGLLADERIGWLARVAVLAAAVAASLAAIWSVLRAHAREVQYSEAIADLAAGVGGEQRDVRPLALARPKRRRAPRPATTASSTVPAPAPAEEGEPPAAADASEAETTISEPVPVPEPDDAEEPEAWVGRWDRHLTWWAAGDTHAKAYMAWAATLALFVLADLAVLIATV